MGYFSQTLSFKQNYATQKVSSKWRRAVSAVSAVFVVLTILSSSKFCYRSKTLELTKKLLLPQSSTFCEKMSIRIDNVKQKYDFFDSLFLQNWPSCQMLKFILQVQFLFVQGKQGSINLQVADLFLDVVGLHLDWKKAAKMIYLLSRVIAVI